MERFTLRIHPNKNFEEIKDEEKREEAKEEFYDEVDFISDYLEKNKINSLEWKQIDVKTFKIEIDTYRDRFNNDIMLECLDDIRENLKIKDVAYATVDNFINYDRFHF